MPYSQNPERVKMLLPYLAYVLERRDCVWNVANRPIKPEAFAYRVREALYISKIARDSRSGDLLFPALAAVADDVIIEVDGTNVYARFSYVLDASLPTPISALGLDKVKMPLSTEAAASFTIDTIAAMWKRRTGNSVHLPMYTPSIEQLLELYEWAQKQDPVVMIMPTDDATSLVEFDEDLIGAEWSPNDI